MSHFTTVKTQIKDIVLLKQVLKDLNYQFTEATVEQKVHVRGYLHQQAEADIVIHASKSYDIGVDVDEEGVSFVADWWGVETTRGVSEEVFIKQIVQRYSYHTVMEAVQAKGYTVAEEEVEEDQTIKLKIKGWS